MLDYLVFDYRNYGYLQGYQIRKSRTVIEAKRRATCIILALEAWKLQHSSLPETLDILVGTCLDKLPNDPYTGELFLYFPDGVKHSFSSDQRSAFGFSNTVEISANEPFLWSTGPEVRPRQYPGVEQQTDLLRYLIWDGNYNVADWRRPATENDLWSSGWPFPIP